MSFILDNWSKLLDSTSDIPTDVKFKIVEKDTDGNEAVFHFQAHKMALALASPVFRREFYGDLKETEDTIIVKDTTIDAFQTLINFVYRKDLNLEVGLQELFEVFNLAEKYDTSELRGQVREKIASWPLSRKNVVKDAAIAENYEHFEESGKFLDRCCIFLKNEIQDLKHIYAFISKYSKGEHREAAMNLLSRMSSTEDKVCSNCNKSPCEHGKPIPKGSMYRGCKIINRTYFGSSQAMIRNTGYPYHFNQSSVILVNALCFYCKNSPVGSDLDTNI